MELSKLKNIIHQMKNQLHELSSRTNIIEKNGQWPQNIATETIQI